jgi:hypothetical protein
MSLILNGTDGLSDVDGSAATPAIRGTDTNTGIFFPAADTIAFAEGGAEVARFDSSGNLGIGTTSPTAKIHAYVSSGSIQTLLKLENASGTASSGTKISFTEGGSERAAIISQINTGTTPYLSFENNGSERMRIDSSGNLLMGKTVIDTGDDGIELRPAGFAAFTRSGDFPLLVNRLTNDGILVSLRQASTEEGSISVSGTTVSYNGGHLARWSQLLDNSKDESLLKGTVLSNLDEMCVWEKDGVVADNEQLNKMKVSDVEGDTNVAGVFVNWTIDEDYGVDDMNIAMTGDMIIRIAEGVTVQRGDLLMSAGDGTSKPQGDDIVRSKTIAKVTSTNITCTYADGSYCVPCVLMAC